MRWERAADRVGLAWLTAGSGPGSWAGLNGRFGPGWIPNGLPVFPCNPYVVEAWRKAVNGYSAWLLDACGGMSDAVDKNRVFPIATRLGHEPDSGACVVDRGRHFHLVLRSERRRQRIANHHQLQWAANGLHVGLQDGAPSGVVRENARVDKLGPCCIRFGNSSRTGGDSLTEPVREFVLILYIEVCSMTGQVLGQASWNKRSLGEVWKLRKPGQQPEAGGVGFWKICGQVSGNTKSTKILHDRWILPRAGRWTECCRW